MTEQTKRIDNILNDFDFDMVQGVMRHLKWRWSDLNNVPEYNDMRETARHLLTRVLQSENTATIAGTGGLWAFDLGGSLFLTFSPVWVDEDLASS